MFESVLQPHVPNLALTWIDLYRGEAPPLPSAFDAFICTGSRCSVYDDEPWIEGLKAFVREAHDADAPFVGICFGHQMLAEALGGKVERADYGWGIGVHDMQILKTEDWMIPARANCRLQYMHADQVQRMPKAARCSHRRRTARSPCSKSAATCSASRAIRSFPPRSRKHCCSTAGKGSAPSASTPPSTL